MKELKTQKRDDLKKLQNVPKSPVVIGDELYFTNKKMLGTIKAKS